MHSIALCRRRTKVSDQVRAHGNKFGFLLSSWTTSSITSCVTYEIFIDAVLLRGTLEKRAMQSQRARWHFGLARIHRTEQMWCLHSFPSDSWYRIQISNVFFIQKPSMIPSRCAGTRVLKKQTKREKKTNWNPQPKFWRNAKREKRASGYLMVADGARRLSIIINSLNYFYFGKAFCWHIANAFWTNWDAEKWHLPPQELRYSTQLLPSNILHSAFVCAASVWYIDSVNSPLCYTPIHLTCGRVADSHVMKQFIFNEFIDEAKWSYENRIRIECDYWIWLCAYQLVYSTFINSAANKNKNSQFKFHSIVCRMNGCSACFFTSAPHKNRRNPIHSGAATIRADNRAIILHRFRVRRTERSILNFSSSQMQR